jgi:hypothetical protein
LCSHWENVRMFGFRLRTRRIINHELVMSRFLARPQQYFRNTRFATSFLLHCGHYYLQILVWIRILSTNVDEWWIKWRKYAFLPDLIITNILGQYNKCRNQKWNLSFKRFGEFDIWWFTKIHSEQ